MDEIVVKMEMQKKILEKKLLRMLEEDAEYDITSSFTPSKTVKAEITAKEEGIVCGIYELSVLFDMFAIEAKARATDGLKTGNKKVVYELKGDSRDILMVERTALNILSRMSGIATYTRRFVDEARRHDPHVRVAATRKTTPLFAYFEKRAVAVGGGDTHRLNLSDEVLIKDNHLKLFAGVKQALETAKKETSFTHKIEIEVSSLKDALSAAQNGADIIMLDNMPPAQIKKVISALSEKGLRDRVLIEASGGINLGNIGEYAGTGVDILSVGALTHSAPSMDYNLKIK